MPVDRSGIVEIVSDIHVDRISLVEYQRGAPEETLIHSGRNGLIARPELSEGIYQGEVKLGTGYRIRYPQGVVLCSEVADRQQRYL